LRYTGPPQGQPWDASLLQSSIVGSITINFQDPQTASVHYSLYGISGELNLTPFANDFAQLYWDASMPGQGVSIFKEGDKAYAVWYLYDRLGNDMWLTVPELSLEQGKSSSFLRFRGPKLGTKWNDAMVSSVPAGSGQFTQEGTAVAMTYELLGGSGTLNLTPFSLSSSSDSTDTSQTSTTTQTSTQENGAQDLNSTDTVLTSVAAYVRYQRDGGQGTCGQEPWLSDDCTTAKDWWGINCFLIVYIQALAIKDGADRWVITSDKNILAQYGFSDHDFFSIPSTVYYNNLQFTYVTPPCQANIQGIDFDANVLGTLENGVFELTYLADPQIHAWGNCGQASFDWITESIKYAWGVAVSGDPMDLTGKIYLEDYHGNGIYYHEYSADTNPSPQNRDHVNVKIQIDCMTKDSKHPDDYISTACPWE